MRWTRKFGVIAALLVAATAITTRARAQVLLDGRPNAVHLEVRHATLRDVLDAMEAKFNLRYRGDDALDQMVSGTFDGPLRRVVTRILNGHDFAMRVAPEGLDVLVLRQSQHGPVVAALPQIPVRPRSVTAQEANRRERGIAQEATRRERGHAY